MTAVPDYVPQLIRGVTDDPKHGGCLVQIANWLGNPSTWTDDPVCVNEILASAAVRINDAVDDEHRRQLALLAPRLTNTFIEDDTETQRVGVLLSIWINERRIPIKVMHSQMEAVRTENGYHLLMTPPYLEADDNPAAVQWLTELIDYYDQLTGRAPVAELPQERWDEVRALVGQ